MPCSPSNLFVDTTFWVIPGIFDSLVGSYQNLSDGDMYDCGLTSVPCESNLVKMLISSNPTLVFWFDLLVIYILLTLAFFMGFIGNISNIIIFSTNDVAADSTNNLLLGLSVSDLMNILSIGMLVTSCYLCFLDASTALTAFNLIMPHMLIASRSFTLLSLDFVTVIAIQRAVAIVLPFKISIIFSSKNTNVIIASLVLLSIIMSIPMHLAYEPLWIYHPYFRKEISLGYAHIVGHKTGSYLATYYFIYRSAVDLVLMFVTGSLTVFKLMEQAKNRASLKASTAPDTATVPKASSRETRVIKMSLTVCFVTFTMCSVAIAVNGMSQVYLEELFRSPLSSSSEYSLLLLASINSSFNFFLYLRMSDKYRGILRNSLRCTEDLKAQE